MNSKAAVAVLREKYQALAHVMDERVLRRWAATEAQAIGWGGISTVAEATGLSRTTIRSGIAELLDPRPEPPPDRIRRPGAGRPRLTDGDPKLRDDLSKLLEPATLGDPEAPLLWTSKSTRHLADALVALGHKISHDSVGRALEDIGYRLQANRKTEEGDDHPDRDAQFEYINRCVRRFQKRHRPAVSVDAKKRELVGDFRNPGREWRPGGSPLRVRTHDFRDKELGIGIPYGVYDLTRNDGWVSVGIDHNTAEFAAESVRRWWDRMGSLAYPSAEELLITADGGGSNGSRARLWKLTLQRLADRLGLRLTVCHFPPGTSKWNKVEHRMFCHITENWRGRPLVSRAVIVNLIGHVRTSEGLRIQAELDTNSYPKGIKVSDEELAEIRLRRAKFHGEWNYTILPVVTTLN
jgi:Rhodopirellula transposase DDE domain